jgi:hypothetical protein
MSGFEEDITKKMKVFFEIIIEKRSVAQYVPFAVGCQQQFFCFTEDLMKGREAPNRGQSGAVPGLGPTNCKTRVGGGTRFSNWLC